MHAIPLTLTLPLPPSLSLSPYPVVSYLYVFASGLLSEYLFHPFLLSTTFSSE